MAPKRWPNLAAMFFDRAAAGGDDPFLWSKHDGEYRPQSWREVAHEVSALSRGLRAAGVVPGDRVALVSENRPNWVVADLAITSEGVSSIISVRFASSADATARQAFLGFSGTMGITRGAESEIRF